MCNIHNCGWPLNTAHQKIHHTKILTTYFHALYIRCTYYFDGINMSRYVFVVQAGSAMSWNWGVIQFWSVWYEMFTVFLCVCNAGVGLRNNVWIFIKGIGIFAYKWPVTIQKWLIFLPHQNATVKFSKKIKKNWVVVLIFSVESESVLEKNI